MQQKSYMLVLLICFISLSSQYYIQTPESNGFNLQLAKTYVAYGILSYCPKKCLESWSCEFSKSFPKLVNVTHVNNDITLAAAYVGYEPISQAIIVSWRGSSNAENWIEDFNFEMQPFQGCKGCYIHVGFNADYRLNEKKLSVAIQNLLRNFKVSKIVLSGHSLGASMASIHAVYLALSDVKVPLIVYNFGSPRYGNENLAQFTKEKVTEHYRIVHNRDMVPHLPPQVEYKHAAYEIFFSKDMATYQVCDGSGEDHSCSNKFFPDYTAADHDFYFYRISETKC